MIRKPNVIELYIDGWLASCSNSYDNLQARLFELLVDKIDLQERTTKEVMELYYNGYYTIQYYQQNKDLRHLVSQGHDPLLECFALKIPLVNL